MSLMAKAVLILGLLPMLWSLLILWARPHPPLSDRREKAALWLMLTPFCLGGALLCGAQAFPDLRPPPVAPLVETLTHAVAAPPAEATAPARSLPNLRQIVETGLNLSAVLWLIGLSLGAARLIAAQWTLHRLGQTGQIMAGHRDVKTVNAALPPLALRRVVLLPQSLMRHLSPEQLQLIIAHERMHQRRGDTLYFPLLSWLEAIFWFNPALRHQTRRCRQAAELACDALVVGARPDMRRVYADTLLTTLKHTAGSVRQHAPAAFSTTNSGDFRMRIIGIMHPDTGRRKTRPLLAVGAALLLIPLAGVQMGWAAQALKAEGTFSAFPLAGRLSSGFGMRTHPLTGKPALHKGMDIAAPEGTPVKSVGNGIVVFAGVRDTYHTVVEVAYGPRKVRYAQLGSIAVKAGDTVRTGQTLGTVGHEGTGPHLHLEVWQDDQPTDPLDSFAPIQIAADAIATNTQTQTLKATGRVTLKLGDQVLTAKSVEMKIPALP